MGKEKESIESVGLKLIRRLTNLEGNIKNNLLNPETIYTAGDIQINEFIRNIDRFEKIVPDLEDFDDGDSDWLDELLGFREFLKKKGEHATTSDTLKGCIGQIVQMKQKLQPFIDHTLERNKFLEEKNYELEQKLKDQEKEIYELKDKNIYLERQIEGLESRIESMKDSATEEIDYVKDAEELINSKHPDGIDGERKKSCKIILSYLMEKMGRYYTVSELLIVLKDIKSENTVRDNCKFLAGTEFTKIKIIQQKDKKPMSWAYIKE